MNMNRATACMIPLFFLSSVSSFGQQGMVNGSPTHYLNFESPQVKPIAVARISSTDYVLACNTPDNSIEIYDVPNHTLVARVPVGLEPVSVVWSDVTQSLYACNFIGDSITKVALSTSPTGLDFLVEKTLNVGDEPMHCAVIPGVPNVLAVSLGSSSELAWLDADSLTLLPNPRTRLDDLATPENIITDPRSIAVTAAGAVLVLGGQANDQNDDFQLYQNTAIQNGGSFLPVKGGLGNLNFNMTPPSTRKAEVYVVAGQSRQASGEKQVATQPFGFVESQLTRFENPMSPGPAVLDTRNLNQDPNGGGPVGFGSAISQPMDVVAYEDAQGVVQRVYVASFGTDRVAQIANPGAAASAWVIRTEDIPATTPGLLTGPRGLAISYGGNGSLDDRIYVLCRLDNSIAYLDALTGKYRGRFDLDQDPTPEYIRRGRRFLYDSKLSSTGFVSCASCHVDGRTDQEGWHLSEHPGSQGFDGARDLTSALVDGFADDKVKPIIDWGFEHEKGVMGTQSLQGLVNFETDPSNKNETTNAPYHWRGDKIDFVAFGGAFRSLLLGPSDPADERFVSESDMQAFERFVNSIHYPPNPEQEVDRRLSGSLGELGTLLNPAGTGVSGSGSLLGLKAFHIEPIATDSSCAGRSCVQCHSLPEGSNNFMTQFFGVGFNDQALETPALRGVARKDSRFEPVGPGTEIGRAGSGIFHTGSDAADLNDFVSNFFQTAEVKQGIIDFVRGLDTGTAPVVGRSVTVGQGGPTTQDLLDIELFEDQAVLANCEIVVEVWRNDGSYQGYWCDLANSAVGGGSLFAYRPEPPTTQTMLPHQILTGYLGSDPTDARVVIFHAVPLGTSRRMASPTGLTAPLDAVDPSSLQLGELTPNSAYKYVPLLTKNVEVPMGGAPATDDQFDWGAVSMYPEVEREPQFLQRLRILQAAAGLNLRHEAPRRIQVLGEDIAYGAVLELRVGASQQTVIKVPIYATGKKVEDLTVWTSAVEFEPLKFTPVDFDPAPGRGVEAVGSGYMSWLFGGPGNPSVDRILDITRSVDYDEFNLPVWIDLDLANNVHEITVTNENGTTATAGQQSLSLSPPPNYP